MCQIMRTIETMCDTNNPQDKKTLLLAKLVDDRFNTIEEFQKSIIEKVDFISKNVSNELTKLDRIVSVIQSDRDDCPVYQNKEKVNDIMIFVRRPKLTLLLALGLGALAGIGSGEVGQTFIKWIITLIK